ncbi:MAG TPA: hypothetical protein PK275_11225 [Chitinophagaceae bacterium]|nr:hypothetical protein [Chitinophagaceae bacterium]
MKKQQPAYNNVMKGISIIMMLALLWLTVCTPVLFASQVSAQSALAHSSEDEQQQSSNNNPLTSSTEEKAPSSISLSEEYLHHSHTQLHPWFSIVSDLNHSFADAVYVAWHGELHYPPPNC